MPTVPMVVTPSVGLTQAPGEMADDRAPLRRVDNAGKQWEQVGQGLQTAGMALSAAQAQQRAINNEATAKDADAQTTDAFSKILHDPDTGYMNTVGKDAVDTFDAAQKALQDQVDKQASGIQDPDARRMYALAAQQRVNATLDAMRQHASQQNKVYLQGASKARSDAAQDAAVLAYNPAGDNTASDSPFQQNMQVARSELAQQAQMQGMSQDQAIQFIGQNMARVHVGVIDHLLAQNSIAGTKAAKDYFAANKDELASVRDANGELIADKIQTVLTAASRQDQALQTYLDLGKQYGPANVGAITGAADKQFQSGAIDAQTHDMIVQRAKAQYEVQQSQQSQADRATLGAVWDGIKNGTYTSVTDLPPGVYGRIVSRDLGPTVDSMFNARKAEANAVDDSHSFVALSHMAADDPEGFANLNLFTQGLTPAHIEHFAQLQGAVDKKDARVQSLNRLYSATVKTVVGELKAANVDPGAKAGTSGAQDYAGFQTAAFTALNDELDRRRAAGHPATMDDATARGIVLGVLKNQTLAGTGFLGLWQTSGPAFKVVTSIPDADRAAIAAKLTAGGLPATPSNIVDYYNRSKGAR